MDYLARREHSRQELTAKLGRKGYEPDCIEATLDGLERDGLQSDRRFAEAFASSRLRRGKGPLGIRAGLRQAGIGGSDVEDALVAAVESAGTDWTSVARDVRARKFGEDRASEPREIARQTRFLLQRGFTAEQARHAIYE